MFDCSHPFRRKLYRRTRQPGDRRILVVDAERCMVCNAVLDAPLPVQVDA